MDRSLENAMVELVRYHRFYSNILLRIKKKLNPKIPTMRINISDGFTLEYNPRFFNDRTLEGKIDLLKHEIMHLGFSHFKRAEGLGVISKDKPKSFEDVFNRMKKASLWNIAADIAINQMLPNLPKKFKLYDDKGEVIVNENSADGLFSPCTVEELEKQIPNVKRNMPMEYYYHLMCKEGGTENSTLLDDHEGFMSEEGEEASEEMKKEMVKHLFNEAAKDFGDPGNMPGEIAQILENINNKTRDWRDDINAFVSRSTCTDVISTRRRRNRRYGWKYPGYRYEPKLVLPVVLDTSISVDDESQGQFMAEIGTIAELGVKVVLIHCDTQVNRVEEYSSDNIPKIYGRGGTCFAPAFNYVNSEEFSEKYGEPNGLIYFTDGDNFDDVQEPDFPVLWALLKGCKSKYSWGEKTVIEVNKKVA